MPEESIARFRETILTWFSRCRRDLPWRHTTDPYHILVSEVMLQQTQVDRVVKKYPEFLSKFPTPEDLASAPLPSVLMAWQGMGYNRRAIALRECARKIQQEYGGQLPGDVELLEQFPGIGRATARSIAVFAFNAPEVFIETNIRRVFLHFFFAGRAAVPDTEILPFVAAALDHKDPRAWYSALMDYGSMLKTTVSNPNRRSAHYSRQTGFAGSDRQLRGRILDQLLRDPGQEEDDLIRKIAGQDPDRVRRLIKSLIAEGFLEREGLRVRIRDA